MTHKRFLVMLSSMSLLVLCSECYGQGRRDTILLGGQELSLGMSKSEVLSKLSNEFRLDRPLPDDVWYVSEKGESPEGVGKVEFKNGKLSHVSKEWRRKNKSEIEALYGVIAQFVKEGRTTCAIGTDTSHSPDSDIKTAWIVCGKKSISISSASVLQEKVEDIYEELKAE